MRTLVVAIGIFLVLLLVRWREPAALPMNGLAWPLALALVVAAGTRLSRWFLSAVAARRPWAGGLFSITAVFTALSLATGVSGPLLVVSLVVSVLLAGWVVSRSTGPLPPDVTGFGRLLLIFGLTAGWYVLATGLLPAAHGAPRWPGLLLGGLAVAVRLAEHRVETGFHGFGF